MFMCKETLRKSVVQKFKEEITDTIETFEDVIDYCNNFFKKEERKNSMSLLILSEFVILR